MELALLYIYNFSLFRYPCLLFFFFPLSLITLQFSYSFLFFFLDVYKHTTIRTIIQAAVLSCWRRLFSFGDRCLSHFFLFYAFLFFILCQPRCKVPRRRKERHLFFFLNEATRFFICLIPDIYIYIYTYSCYRHQKISLTRVQATHFFLYLIFSFFFFFTVLFFPTAAACVFLDSCTPVCTGEREEKKKHRKQFSSDARISREQKQEGRKGKANVHVLLGLFLLLVFFIVVYMKPIYAFTVGYVNLYSLLSHSSYANKPVSCFRF